MYQSVMKITRMRHKALPDGRPTESQCSTTKTLSRLEFIEKELSVKSIIS